MGSSNSEAAAARRTQIWTAIIAALGGVAAAGIGLAGTLLATEASITTRPVAEPGTAQSQNAAVAPPADPSAETPLSSPAGSVYHNGVVSLPAGGTSIDFEAPPEDDRWTSDVSRNRIAIHPVGALEMNLRTFVLPAGDRASFDYCSQSTLYVRYDSNDSDEITTGTVLCAQSDAGRFGTIRIVSKSRDLWKFEITTWKV